jgi:hypothetical protein
MHDPNKSVLLAQIDSRSFGMNAADSVHHVYVDGDVLYAAISGAGEIFVYDVKTPARPRFLQVLYDASNPVYVMGSSRLYVSSKYPSQTLIYDGNQVVGYPCASGVGFCLGSPSQVLQSKPTKNFFSGTDTHQSWPLAGEKYLAIAHEAGKDSSGGATSAGDVSIWDISGQGLAATEISSINLQSELPALPALQIPTVHTVKIDGNLLYAAWYEAGLRVYDVTNPRAPMLKSCYETASEIATDVRGTWMGAQAVYPYSPIGIAVSDEFTGLWLFKRPNP